MDWTAALTRLTRDYGFATEYAAEGLYEARAGGRSVLNRRADAYSPGLSVSIDWRNGKFTLDHGCLGA